MPRIQNSRTCGSGYCLACARRGSGMWSNTSSSDAIRAPSIGFPKCHSAPSSRHPWENRTALHDELGQKYLFKFCLLEVDEGDLRLKPGLTDAPGNPLCLLSPSCSVAGVFPIFFAAPQCLIDALHLCRQPEGKLLSGNCSTHPLEEKCFYANGL